MARLIRMTTTRMLAALLALAVVLTGKSAPANPAEQEAIAEPVTTPVRISYVYGQVAFWRPGAAEWVPATVNTPLAPGDLLYTGADGNVELQVGPRAFVRAAIGTHLGLENREPEFIQFKVTEGHVALDVRERTPGGAIELDTPNAVLTVERTGFYRVEVVEDRSVFVTRRGGVATVTAADADAATVVSNQQLIVSGAESPRLARAEAPALADWERWNYQRTSHLLDSPSANYVPTGVYGTHELDQHGTWRVVETYGPVWAPRAVPAGWVPYSTGRWIWDPIYGWTWLDDAPWGWAPYHYGRWVFVGGGWAWAPGPRVVRPVYAPALVAFFGGPSVVSRPVFWVALGWGEPIVPWWGPRGFVGRPWWGGWGGPRVVNNVVVNKTTVVNVNHITVYRNASVTNAVVGVPGERFGRGHVTRTRVARADAQQLEPVRGALPIKPVAASVMPASGPVAKPPASVVKRPVVATRAPREVSALVRAEGLAPNPPPATSATSPATSAAPPTEAPAPRIVPAPARGSAARSRDDSDSGARAGDRGNRREPGKATVSERTTSSQDASTAPVTRPTPPEQPGNGKSQARNATIPKTAPSGRAQPSDVGPGRGPGRGAETPAAPTAPAPPATQAAASEPPQRPGQLGRPERPEREQRSAQPPAGQPVERSAPPRRPEPGQQADDNGRVERRGPTVQRIPAAQIEEAPARQRQTDQDVEGESRSRPRGRQPSGRGGDREDASPR